MLYEVITSDKECKIDLNTTLQNETANVGNNVRMNIVISNKTNDVVPMTIAEIGIPAGLSLQTWQLKELSDKKQWDYYEIFDGKLVIYFVDMDANEKHEINIDLKADLPGTYTAKASCAYLYYTNEFKTWNYGSMIKILE